MSFLPSTTLSGFTLYSSSCPLIQCSPLSSAYVFENSDSQMSTIHVYPSGDVILRTGHNFLSVTSRPATVFQMWLPESDTLPYVTSRTRPNALGLISRTGHNGPGMTSWTKSVHQHFTLYSISGSQNWTQCSKYGLQNGTRCIETQHSTWEFQDGTHCSHCGLWKKTECSKCGIKIFQMWPLAG